MLDQNGMEDQDIHKAAETGDLAEIKRLVTKKRKRIHANGWFGLKPLHYAARMGDLECVEYLVNKGADVNAESVVKKTTPVFESSTEEVARFLVEHGATLDIVSTNGRVPLDYAIQGGYVDVVRFLVEYGVDVNYLPEVDCHRTMMQWTDYLFPDEKKHGDSKSGNIAARILEILLKAGGNPNQKNAYGTTVLHLAVKRERKPIIELLLKHDADPCIRDESGNSCFEYTENPDILALLEPYKKNLKEIIIKQDDFDTLIERIIATGVVGRLQFSPCRESEINDLEKSHGVILPAQYKRFLRVMGKGAGAFLRSDHWSIFLPDLNDFLGNHFWNFWNEDLDADEFPVEPIDNFFVFASRLADFNLGFFADGVSDDPDIYSIDD
ncbi:MAG: hypothetical protein GY765_20570, partial [bacterium]|nr:hypothetical protein [bacterium]